MPAGVVCEVFIGIGPPAQLSKQRSFNKQEAGGVHVFLDGERIFVNCWATQAVCGNIATYKGMIHLKQTDYCVIRHGGVSVQK
jgi:hypothetical protein